MGLFDALNGLFETGAKVVTDPIKVLARPGDADTVLVDTAEAVITSPVTFLEDLFD